MHWYELIRIEKSDLDQISAEVQVPPESPWFCGHFPEEPILPGIAQLGMVCDAIRRSSHQEPKVSGISRVRFKQMIRPGDRLAITVKPRKGRDKSFAFQVRVGSEVACSGVMALAHQT